MGVVKILLRPIIFLPDSKTSAVATKVVMVKQNIKKGNDPNL